LPYAVSDCNGDGRPAQLRMELVCNLEWEVFATGIKKNDKQAFSGDLCSPQDCFSKVRE
jgi:hypothetical protein